ncbi:hypothetical protein Taro_034590, partial [Colocasia esculenta]|nr:hypothetical protein [Colocasia esculenta]
MPSRGRGSTFLELNICFFKGGNLGTFMLSVDWWENLAGCANLPTELTRSPGKLPSIGMGNPCGNIRSGFRDLLRDFAELHSSSITGEYYKPGLFLSCPTSASTIESSCFPRNHRRAEKRFEVGIFGTYLSRGVVGGVPSRRTRTFPIITDLPDLEMAVGGLLLGSFSDIFLSVSRDDSQEER